MRFEKVISTILVGLLSLPAFPKPVTQKQNFQSKIAKDLESVHLLNRLTFGPRPGDIQTINKLGTKKWIDLQLHPERIEESPELAARLEPLESLRLANSELTRKYPPPQMVVAYATGRYPVPTDPEERQMLQRLAERYKNKLDKKGVDDKVFGGTPRPVLADLLTAEQLRVMRKGTPEQRRELFQSLPKETMDKVAELLPRALMGDASPEARRKALKTAAPQQVVAHDLQEGKLLRAVYSNRQLQEVLTDFWFNHFNVYIDKGADRYLVTSYERDAIRPNVLGKFQTMLQATAENPAMLFYLDNWQSVAPESQNARRQRPLKAKTRGLNENYARELLELHTLGVDGGYTQKDIIEIARCFTGWTIKTPYIGAEFAFNERVHDQGEKVVLGVTIPAGGGKEDGLKVLDIVAHHPSTARFVSRKLAQRFVADNPPEELVTSMAATFQKTDGDLREVMRTMLNSKAFWSQAAFKSKVKSPFEMAVSALRAMGAEVNYALGVATKVAEFGQPLYGKVEPTGYSNNSEEWVNSGALLARMNFALALAKNELPGVRVKQENFEGDPNEVAREILFGEASAQTKEAIQRGIAESKTPAIIAGLVMGSPEFQRR